MTKEEFINQYCQDVSYEWLQEHGRIAIPCDCDYEECQGWQMGYIDD